MKKSLITLMLVGSSLLLSGCNDDDKSKSDQNIDDNSIINQIKNPVVGTPRAYVFTDLSDFAQDSVVMTYKMQGISGKETQATSLVFTPKSTPPVVGWPIVVWAHGTTGVADQCAPSQNAMTDSTLDLISQLLKAGYVVVAPDYEGLGDPVGDAHPFLNLKSEGYSIADAVVAARDWLGAKASKQWLTVGHSQGGHAALGAAQYAARANIEYKGTVAVAPASNLSTIFAFGNQYAQSQSNVLDKIGTYASLNTYAALIVAGMQGYANPASYDQVFQPDSAAVAPIAATKCANELGGAFATSMGGYVQNNGGSIAGYGLTQPNFMQVPAIATFISSTSQPLTVQVTTPIKIYQGLADTTVPYVATDALLSSANAKGTKITYITSQTWTHSTAMSDNIDNIVQDVKAYMPIQ